MIDPVTAASAAAATDEVPVLLDGAEYRLKATLRAAIAVDTHFEGFFAAYGQLRAYRLAAFLRLAEIGLDARTIDERDAIHAKVFATGMRPLLKPFSDYLEALSNGGRAPAAAKPAGDDAGKE